MASYNNINQRGLDNIDWGKFAAARARELGWMAADSGSGTNNSDNMRAGNNSGNTGNSGIDSWKKAVAERTKPRETGIQEISYNQSLPQENIQAPTIRDVFIPVDDDRVLSPRAIFNPFEKREAGYWVQHVSSPQQKAPTMPFRPVARSR